MADQYTRLIEQMLRGTGSGAGVVYNLMPAITGAATPGVQATAGAGAMGTAVKLTTTAITTEFWACGMVFYTTNGAQVFFIQMLNASTVIANWVLDLTTTTFNLGPIPVGPYPIYLPASTVVNYQAGGAAGKTLYGHLWYATGL
jgi:hypothetical protein